MPGTSLTERPEPEQDEVVAGLLQRLWATPPPDGPFRPLRELCDLWAAGAKERARAATDGFDAELCSAGTSLLRRLAAAASERSVVLVTDLHAGNVLASTREPWLVIDPKPYVGDPAYDVTQHLLNCADRLREDASSLIARVAGMADVDAGRVREWMFARCALQSPALADLKDVAHRLAPS